MKIDFFTGTEPIWNEPQSKWNVGSLLVQLPPLRSVSIQLLSIDNLIATEFLGQTIDDHQREELLDKG